MAEMTTPIILDSPQGDSLCRSEAGFGARFSPFPPSSTRHHRLGAAPSLSRPLPAICASSFTILLHVHHQRRQHRLNPHAAQAPVAGTPLPVMPRHLPQFAFHLGCWRARLLVLRRPHLLLRTAIFLLVIVLDYDTAPRAFWIFKHSVRNGHLPLCDCL